MAEIPARPGSTPPAARRPRTPSDIAAIIARNITPIACLLFFATSPESLVALYSIDTMLSIYALVWLVMEHITEAKSAERGVWRVVKFGFSALLLGTLLNLLLILPMGIVFESSDWLRTKPWLDANFRTAVFAQVVGSGYALIQAHRMLQLTDDDDHILGERFKFIIARWIVVLGAVFFGLATFFGAFIGSALIVVLYAGASIYFELFPEKAHQLFHGKPKPADAATGKKPRLP